MDWNKIDWTHIDKVKIAGGATIVGSLLAVVLSSTQVDQVAHIGGIVENVLIAATAGVTALLIALRKKA